MLKKWLSIVGIGEDGLIGVNPQGRSLIAKAKVLVGGKRHLAMLPIDDSREKLAWKSPISESIAEIAHYRGEAVCVLATGDPLCYGIGVTLMGHFPLEEMTIVPHISAFSLACARLGWSLTEVETLSLCGRNSASINSYLYPNNKLLVLSAQGNTPAVVAKSLTQQGWGKSKLVVLERMGGKHEGRIEGIASDWSHQTVADLNIIAITCVQDQRNQLVLPRLPGLPDTAYRHDGQITKSEIRAITMCNLAPLPGELLWDLGAGCGSIAIEWMRSNDRCQAIAVEKNQSRVEYIQENAIALGTPNLQIISQDILTAIISLPQPNAIFIGGGLTTPQLGEICWQALPPGGRMVANAVTVEGEQKLFNWQKQWGGQLSRFHIQRSEPLGKFSGWKAMAPVTQWVVIKV